MHATVKAKFKSFNAPFEGVVRFMYLDVKGLVTVGVGNLIDPVGLALSLPFRYKSKPGTTGGLASRGEIEAEWHLIKSTTELAKKGHRACAPLTKLELDDAAIDRLVAARLAQNESFLKRQKPFKEFESWPADAQLGLLSMAWAMGPGFALKWPKFSASCTAMDFAGAATNCRMSEAGNAGIVPRNRANARLFNNAAVVLDGEDDGVHRNDILYYPQVLAAQQF